MRKKHIVIEILPRALWIIEILCLIYIPGKFEEFPIFTNNYFLLFLGSVFLILGIFSFVFSFIYLFKAMFSKKLITTGPYQYSRHPLYLSVYFALIGFGLIINSYIWWLILVAFVPVWYLDCRLEEQQMTDLHGQTYLNYKKTTGMFLPK